MARSNKRSGIQLLYPFETRRITEAKFGWKWPVAVQPKLDGERAHPIAHLLPDVEFVSSECNHIISVPHINEAYREQGITVELDGEFYVHGMSFDDIHSIVSRKSLETIHPQAHKMQFHVFDIAWPNGPQIQRLANIPYLEPPLYLVQTRICHNFEDIMYFFDKYGEEGYEGIVVRELRYPYERKRSRFCMKFKPKKTDDYEILDCIEAIDKTGEPKGIIGAFLLAGDDGTEFKVGAGMLTHKQRFDIWYEHCVSDSVRGTWCRVNYQNITSKGRVPRFGLAVSIIK